MAFELYPWQTTMLGDRMRLVQLARFILSSDSTNPEELRDTLFLLRAPISDPSDRQLTRVITYLHSDSVPVADKARLMNLYQQAQASR